MNEKKRLELLDALETKATQDKLLLAIKTEASRLKKITSDNKRATILHKEAFLEVSAERTKNEKARTEAQELSDINEKALKLLEDEGIKVEDGKKALANLKKNFAAYEKKTRVELSKLTNEATKAKEDAVKLKNNAAKLQSKFNTKVEILDKALQDANG